MPGTEFHLLEISPNEKGMGYPFNPEIKFDGLPLKGVQSIIIEASALEWVSVTLKLVCNVKALIPIEIEEKDD